MIFGLSGEVWAPQAGAGFRTCLASNAAAGEALISQATSTSNAARIDTAGLEQRLLELKGKSEAVPVFVLHAGG